LPTYDYDSLHVTCGIYVDELLVMNLFLDRDLSVNLSEFFNTKNMIDGMILLCFDGY